MFVGVMGRDFVDYLLSTVESESCDERTVDILVEVLLSFNQHFTHVSDNMVMHCLAEQIQATVLSERLLSLFNRGGTVYDQQQA